MRKLKWTMIITDLLLILLGVAFVAKPELMESTMCYLLAALVALVGLMYLAGYFIQKADQNGEREGNGFAVGLLLIFIAVFIMVRQEVIIALVPFLFGFLVVIRGLMIIQNTFMFRRLRFSIWVPLGTGLLSMALGLFIMLFPFDTMRMLFMLIGISLIVGGVSGLVHEFLLWNLQRKAAHEMERIKDMAVSARGEARRAEREANLTVDEDTAVIDVEAEPVEEKPAAAAAAAGEAAEDAADAAAKAGNNDAKAGDNSDTSGDNGEDAQ